MHCIALHCITRQDKTRQDKTYIRVRTNHVTSFYWKPLLHSLICLSDGISFISLSLLDIPNKQTSHDGKSLMIIFISSASANKNRHVHTGGTSATLQHLLEIHFYRENSRTGHILFFVAHPPGGFPDFLCWLNCEFDWICGILRYVLAFYEYLPPINSGINHLSTLCLIIFVMDIVWETIHTPSEDPGFPSIYNPFVEGTLWYFNSLLLNMAHRNFIEVPIKDGDFP